MEAIASRQRHYCVVCSNYRGKVVEERVLQLHRFPADDRLRRAWIRRIKLIKPNYKWNESQRLCSEHFTYGKKKGNEIPSVFASKTFEKNQLDEFEEERLNQTEAVSTVGTEGFITEGEEEPGPQTNILSETALEMSVLTHDYLAGTPLNISKFVNKSEQTEITSKSTSSTQTCSNATVETATQTDFVYVTTYDRQAENSESTYTKPVMKDFTVQCEKPPKTIEDIENSNEKCMFYTGVPNAKILYTLFDEMSDVCGNTTRNRMNSESGSCSRNIITNSESGGRPRRLRAIDEFFLVLMRLRLGLLLEDLADRFFISKSTCGNIVDRWLEYLHVKFSFLVSWPSKSVIKNTMPNKFRRKYPNCRVIIDCTEFFTETPQSLVNKSLLYSHYKSHMTYKALLGISPSGVITFASDLWAGSISDKQITKQSGILELCETGDAIMADKGFLISDLTTPRGIHLIIPPFKTKRFTRREIEETRRIANLRIDIERAVERVKNFRILSGVIPITLSKKTSKTFKICAGLSNLQGPLVHDEINDEL